VLVKRHLQVFGNHFSRSTFNVMAFNHVDEFAVFEQRNAWRTGRVGQHELPGSVDSISVDTGEGRGEFPRDFVVLNGEFDRWPHGTGRASAHAVQDDKDSAWAADGLVYIFRRDQFFKSDTREVGFHRSYQFWWVHVLCVFRSKFGLFSLPSQQLRPNEVLRTVPRESGWAHQSSRLFQSCSSGTR
jgi:hypothetical protein